MLQEPLRAPRLFRRLLIKGIAFSIFFHAGFFILFQIKSLPIPNTSSPSSTVYITPFESPIMILSPKSIEEDPRQKYAKEFHLQSKVPKEDFCTQFFSNELKAVVASKDDYAPIHPILPWDYTDHYAPSHVESYVYPLKITLHSSLRHLACIDDASCLFSKATSQTLQFTPLIAINGPKLDFQVKISPAFGKIEQIICLKKTHDNRLQLLAETVLQKLQFYTRGRASKKNVWGGTISIQFYGSYDNIAPLLNTSEVSP
jgi:hypothetical protein